MDEDRDIAARLADAVRVTFPVLSQDVMIKDAGMDGGFLSPTDSEGSRKWSTATTQRKKDIRSRFSDEQDTNVIDGYYGNGDQSPMLDWITDSPMDTRYDLHGGVKRDSVAVYNHLGQESRISGATSPQARRPSIQINGISTKDLDSRFLSPSSDSISPSPNSSTGTSPLARYRGWVSEVLAPLEDFIDHATDPKDLYADLQEIAEGDSGSVYVARVVDRRKAKKSRAADGDARLVAIKCIPLVPGGSQKLVDLRKELLLMSCIRHENVLAMDGLYVDLAEDTLWIKMELMERSLADMLQLAEEGLLLQEKAIAQFTADVSPLQ